MRATRIAAAMWLVPCCVASIASAWGEEAGLWYALPSASFVATDTDRGTENDLGASVAVGKHLSARATLELKASGNSLHHHVEGSWQQRSVSLDGLCFSNRDKPWAAYGVAAAGIMRNRLGATHSTNPYAELGGGLVYRFYSRGPTLRSDVRWRADRDDKTQLQYNGYTDVVFNVGVAFPINE